MMIAEVGVAYDCVVCVVVARRLYRPDDIDNGLTELIRDALREPLVEQMTLPSITDASTKLSPEDEAAAIAADADAVVEHSQQEGPNVGLSGLAVRLVFYVERFSYFYRIVVWRYFRGIVVPYNCTIVPLDKCIVVLLYQRTVVPPKHCVFVPLYHFCSTIVRNDCSH